MSLLIKNVLIEDEERKQSSKKDVLIKEGLILAVGDLPEYQAEQVVDGQGKFITPGFVDVDSASFFVNSFLEDGVQENYLRQGITTVVAGHGGLSLAPLYQNLPKVAAALAGRRGINLNWNSFGEYRRALQKNKYGVHFYSLVGVNNLSHPDERVSEKMLEEAYQNGALGLSLKIGKLAKIGRYEAELALRTALKGKIISVLIEPQDFDQRREVILKLLQEKRKAETGKVFISLITPDDVDYLKRSRSQEEAAGSYNPQQSRIVTAEALLPAWFRQRDFSEMNRGLRDRLTATRLAKEIQGLKNHDIRVIRSARSKFGDNIEARSYAKDRNLSFGRGVVEMLCRHGVESRLAISPNQEKKYDLLKNKNVFLTSLGQGEGLNSTFNDFLKEGFKRADWNVPEVVAKINTEPVEALGLRAPTKIQPGEAADLVLFDDQGVGTVIVGGKISYQNGQVIHYNRGGSLKAHVFI